MSLYIKVSITGTEPILNDLGKAQDRFERPLGPILREVGDLLVKNIRERFDAKLDPKGRPLQPQSDVTQKISPRGSLLVESGEMRRSIGVKSIGGGVVKVGTVGDPKQSYVQYYGIKQQGKRSAVPGSEVPGRWWLGGIRRRTFGRVAQRIEAYFLGDDYER